MRNLRYLTYALVIIGALNWGFVGFFDFNLVSFMFGEGSILSKIVYSLVGLSAVIDLVLISSGYKLEKGMAH